MECFADRSYRVEGRAVVNLRRILGALIILGATICLLLIRVMNGPDDSCRQDAMFALKGTFADCTARDAAQSVDHTGAQVAAR